MKTLVDTSVWIEHFKKSNKQLIALLEADLAVTHELILGEISAGNISRREQTLDDLQKLNLYSYLPYPEVRAFIDKNKLHGKGLSIIDIHILMSCLANDLNLFTLDKTLNQTWNHFKKNLL